MTPVESGIDGLRNGRLALGMDVCHDLKRSDRGVPGLSKCCLTLGRVYCSLSWTLTESSREVRLPATP